MRKPYKREEKNTLGYTTLVYPAADNLLLITIDHLIFFFFCFNYYFKNDKCIGSKIFSFWGWIENGILFLMKTKRT